MRDRDQEYRRFHGAVYFWLDRIGLKDWEVQVQCVPFGRRYRDTYARVLANWQNRVALIQWNGTSASLDESPEDIAKHEVLHVLLSASLNLAALAGCTDAPAVDAEEHAVIRRLMKLLRSRNGD